MHLTWRDARYYYMNRMTALIEVILILLLGWSTLFVVDQRKYAVIRGFGGIKRVIASPGIHFKLPAPFESVTLLDKRIQTVVWTNPKHYRSIDGGGVFLKLYIKWRIAAPRRYSGRFDSKTKPASQQLSQLVDAELNAQFARRSNDELISDRLDGLMKVIRKRAAAQADKIGIEIVDIRLTYLDFPADHSDSVYRRMKDERKQMTDQLRAASTAEVAQIRADADLQRETILAQAYRRAQIIKGEGDARSAAIYASAFKREPQFYRFYKSLDAYRQSFHERDIIVVNPSSEFFRFMQSPNGAASGQH
jgi:modulator of FtsH protease HflC